MSKSAVERGKVKTTRAPMQRKQLTVDLEPLIHTRLRDEAVRRGTSMNALAQQALKPFLDKLPPAQHELATPPPSRDE
jgi:predicted HicB family RNase H-like nuclease